MTVQRSANRMDLPPPPDLDLLDDERRVGWIAGESVGFRGFADETEAAHAAWVAYRALARRLAKTHGTRPVPIDTEPLALQRRGEEELILASGRAIATLVRPGAASPSGSHSFGFEIRVPQPADALRVRAMGHLMYRTLRKSGLRWAMWRPAPTRAKAAAALPASDLASGRIRENASPHPITGGEVHVPEPRRERGWWTPLLEWRRGGRPGWGWGAARLAAPQRR